MVKPLLAYLKDHGVQFEYDCHVDNVVVDHEGKQKVAKKIVNDQEW